MSAQLDLFPARLLKPCSKHQPQHFFKRIRSGYDALLVIKHSPQVRYAAWAQALQLLEQRQVDLRNNRAARKRGI